VNRRRSTDPAPIAVAEFFAGVGLVRLALERHGCRVVFANDVDETKRRIYAANFGADEYRLCDVRTLRGDDVPDVDVATASFPCTDLSLAGTRKGLAGEQSGTVWEFFRILHQMGPRRPRVVMLENVPGFVTSHGGLDLQSALVALNDMGYRCDLLTLDARWFVPQSRARVFVVATTSPVPCASPSGDERLRPAWIREFLRVRPGISTMAADLPPPPTSRVGIDRVVERPPPDHESWWRADRVKRFLDSLSPLQTNRLRARVNAKHLAWSTAYRRTREGRPVWEIRADDVAGCLRTTRGGSSKQAVVEMGRGAVRVRWMTAREYARLMGADTLRFGDATESQARFALGDAVCVPAVAWLAEHYLVPLARGAFGKRSAANG
jgi:DNA (cytosine-5)-methyltransferase 1